MELYDALYLSLSSPMLVFNILHLGVKGTSICLEASPLPARRVLLNLKVLTPIHSII
jgi:hypothetical protein